MKLIAENLGRRYFRDGKGTNFFYALKDVNFQLEAGALTEITGRSGSGKSTFLNVLAGLLTPDEGRVLLEGQDLYALTDEERSKLRSRHFGIIPQGQTALLSLTVLENVQLPGLLYEKGACSQQDALELLDSVGIRHLAQVYPSDLSGGERRRLAIARALSLKPQIILADEPTADLDDENTAQVLSLLKGLAKEGRSVLLVTHEVSAAGYADLHYRMEAGQLSQL